MTNTELAELLLTTVFDKAEKEGHQARVPLLEVARSFGIDDQMKVHNLAKYLESRDLIQAEYANIGPLARITGSGAIFVEKGGDTGIILKYRKEPQSFVVNIDHSTNIYGDISNSSVAVNSAGTTQTTSVAGDLDEVLRAILQALQADASLSPTQLADAVRDIETLKLQVAKHTKNRSLIESILANLANIASIASYVTQLLPMIFR